jgi:hypothetical protein
MSDDRRDGCVSPAAGPIAPPGEPETGRAGGSGAGRKEGGMQVMVGKEAPDFEASAFYGDGFRNVKLSDFKGKWVFLCFYPGDFTFV